MPQTNVADTPEYQARRTQAQPLFIAPNYQEHRQLVLPLQHILRIDDYAGEVGESYLRGSRCRLSDSRGRLVSEWQSIGNEADFYTPIAHSNGKHYLIFRQDLYGYSVLDFAAGQIMQYFPQASLNGGETFIWTGADYNPINNVLAVSGCYWACPYSILLSAFDDPMAQRQRMSDTLDNYFPDYEEDYDGDIDFVAWCGTDLHYTALRLNAKHAVPEILTQTEYGAWLAA